MPSNLGDTKIPIVTSNSTTSSLELDTFEKPGFNPKSFGTFGCLISFILFCIYWVALSNGSWPAPFARDSNESRRVCLL